MASNDFKKIKNGIRAVVAWVITLLFVFPLFYMFLTAFKTEGQAIDVSKMFFFTPTLENFFIIQERSDYFHYALNSIITSGGSTLLGLAIAVPAAYSMAFFPSKSTRGVLMWMLSTKMMPAVGALLPIYLVSQFLGLLDSRISLVFIFTMINLPIMIWMLYTYFKEIPVEILEAVRLDGAGLWGEIKEVLLPLSLGGIGSTALLCFVLSWNEAFWSITLTASNSGTLAALIASYSSPEGLFWAKLSAVSLLAIAPIIVFGWLTQKQLVQGLTFGAVK